jgi:hypothetical protein
MAKNFLPKAVGGITNKKYKLAQEVGKKYCMCNTIAQKLCNIKQNFSFYSCFLRAYNLVCP